MLRKAHAMHEMHKMHVLHVFLIFQCAVWCTATAQIVVVARGIQADREAKAQAERARLSFSHILNFDFLFQ